MEQIGEKNKKGKEKGRRYRKVKEAENGERMGEKTKHGIKLASNTLFISFHITAPKTILIIHEVQGYGGGGQQRQKIT